MELELLLFHVHIIVNKINKIYKYINISFILICLEQKGQKIKKELQKY